MKSLIRLKSGRYKYILVSIGVFVLFSASVGAMIGSNWTSENKVYKNTPAAIAETPDTLDPEKLKRLAYLLKQVDVNKDQVSFSATLTSLNEADSNVNLRKVPYEFRRKGNDFFYRIGMAETINGDSICLTVDHQKKVFMLSPQKKVEKINALISSDNLEEQIQNQEYTLKSSTEGAYSVLSLVNDKHPECQLYAITYHNSNLKVSRIVTRMTDVDRGTGKVIDVQFNAINEFVPTQTIGIGKYLVKEDSNWKSRKEYRDYELIIMGL
jgi:hypothetical protein